MDIVYRPYCIDCLPDSWTSLPMAWGHFARQSLRGAKGPSASVHLPLRYLPLSQRDDGYLVPNPSFLKSTFNPCELCIQITVNEAGEELRTFLSGDSPAAGEKGAGSVPTKRIRSCRFYTKQNKVLVEFTDDSSMIYTTTASNKDGSIKSKLVLNEAEGITTGTSFALPKVCVACICFSRVLNVDGLCRL